MDMIPDYKSGEMSEVQSGAAGSNQESVRLLGYILLRQQVKALMVEMKHGRTNQQKCMSSLQLGTDVNLRSVSRVSRA